MSDQTKKLVPKLRFSEFMGKSEWNYLNGNKVFEPISNKKHNSDLPILAITQDQGAVPRDLINYKVIATEQSIESYKVVEVGDFIISLRSFQGGIEYSGYKGICSPAYIILRKKIKVIDLFFKYYFKTDLFIKHLNKNIEGIRDGKMVSYSQFSDILLPAPKYEEQQKVADCLSSIDDLITAQSQKIAVLKDHKKGLMQQLFPAEGETAPKLRFPEFESALDWSVRPIGEYIEEYRKNSSYQDEYEVLTSAREGLIRQKEYYDNDRITERDNVGFNVIPPAHLTYRSRSDDRKFYFNENLLGITGIISTYYPVFRIKKGTNKFFVELLSRYSEHVGKYSVGTSQTVLSLNVLKKIELSVPEHQEQQRIADCLFSIDKLITAQTHKLETYKSHKKGLMQQLFPNAVEGNE